MASKWFKHDSDASNDMKLVKLRIEHGWEGCGVFWAIVENLRNSSTYTLPYEPKVLAFHLQIIQSKVEAIMSTCFEVGLLEKERGFFRSPRLTRQMYDADQKTLVRQKAASARWDSKKVDANALQTESICNANTIDLILSSSDLNLSSLKEEGSGGKPKSEATEISPSPVTELAEAKRSYGAAQRVKLTDREFARVYKFFADKNLTQDDAERAIQYLDDQLAKPKYTKENHDHAACLTRWCYKAVLQERQEEARLQNLTTTRASAYERRQVREVGVLARAMQHDEARAKQISAVQILTFEPVTEKATK